MVKSALHLHHLNAHACTTPQGAAIRGQCGAGGCKHRHDTAGNHVLAASAACSWGRRHNQVLVRIRRQQVAVRMQVVLQEQERRAAAECCWKRLNRDKRLTNTNDNDPNPLTSLQPPKLALLTSRNVTSSSPKLPRTPLG